MKTQLLKSLTMATVLSLSFVACEKNINLEEQIGSEMPTADAPLPTEMKYEQKLVAKIQKDGHQIEFVASTHPDIKEMITIESLYGDAASRSNEPFYNAPEWGKTPYQLFIDLTASEEPIPLEIALTAKDKSAEMTSRKILHFDQTVELLDRKYTDNSAARGCLGDDRGYSANVSNCGIPFYSYYENIRFCDSYANTGVINRKSKFGGSWLKARYAHNAINVTCGQVRNSYYVWKQVNGKYKWVLVLNADVSSGNYSVNGGSTNGTAYYRYLRRTPWSSNKHYRMYTRFLK